MWDEDIYIAVVSNKIACNTVMSLLLESIDCLFSAVYVDIPVRLLIRRLWRLKTAPKHYREEQRI
jgi:hypothetical protein